MYKSGAKSKGIVYPNPKRNNFSLKNNIYERIKSREKTKSQNARILSARYFSFFLITKKTARENDSMAPLMRINSIDKYLFWNDKSK